MLAALAQFMFRALSNQDPALSGSAGLSFFLVAVVLDRLTQRDGDNSQSLAARMKRAWANRTTPENLLDTPTIELDLPETASSQVVYEPVNLQERTGIIASIAGAAVVIISLFLTWNSGGGWFTSFSRRVDELGQVPASGSSGAANITADSFNGLEASGGSWFGYVLGFLAILAIAAGLAVMRQPGNTSRWLNADGSLVFSLASLVVAFVYFLSQPSELSVAESSIGSVVALIGALTMTAGSVKWIMAAKHEPLRPLPSQGVVSPVVVASLSMCLLIGAGFANFSYDERVESVITAELQETLDALEAEARDPETEQRRSLAIINEMTSLRASAIQDETITISGFASNGPTMARWTLVPGVLGLISTVIAAGFVFKDTRLRWIAGATSLGLGAGLLGVSLGWTGTLARATDQNIVSGVGVFFLMLAGATLANSGRSIIQEFHRSRVYLDIDDQEIPDTAGVSF